MSNSLSQMLQKLLLFLFCFLNLPYFGSARQARSGLKHFVKLGHLGLHVPDHHKTNSHDLYDLWQEASFDYDDFVGSATHTNDRTPTHSGKPPTVMTFHHYLYTDPQMIRDIYIYSRPTTPRDNVHGSGLKALARRDVSDELDSLSNHILSRREARGVPTHHQPARPPRGKPEAPKSQPDSPPPPAQNTPNAADSAALGRVHGDMDQITAQESAEIDKNHKQAISMLNYENAQAERDKKRAKELVGLLKSDPRNQRNYNRELHQIYQRMNANVYQYNRVNDLQREMSLDMDALADAKQKGDSAQHTEFNDNGSAKSDAQKKADAALAGFLKFLEYFTDIITDLLSIFPGEGELLTIGMGLAKVGTEVAVDASKVGSAISKITKAYKGIDKLKNAKDDIDDFRKMLGLQPGNQQIQGMNGKQMQIWQDYMMNKLLSQMSNNLGNTASKMGSTHSPKRPNSDLQYGMHKGGRCRGKGCVNY